MWTSSWSVLSRGPSPYSFSFIVFLERMKWRPLCFFHCLTLHFIILIYRHLRSVMSSTERRNGLHYTVSSIRHNYGQGYSDIQWIESGRSKEIHHYDRHVLWSQGWPILIYVSIFILGTIDMLCCDFCWGSLPNEWEERIDWQRKTADGWSIFSKWFTPSIQHRFSF